MDQFDHADDAEDQRQPHIVPDRPRLQLPVQDEPENQQADQEVRDSRRHKLQPKPVVRGPASYFLLAECCLTAASTDVQGSQPSCDQTILPEAETKANQG